MHCDEPWRLQCRMLLLVFKSQPLGALHAPQLGLCGALLMLLHLHRTSRFTLKITAGGATAADSCLLHVGEYLAWQRPLLVMGCQRPCVRFDVVIQPL